MAEVQFGAVRGGLEWKWGPLQTLRTVYIKGSGATEAF